MHTFSPSKPPQPPSTVRVPGLLKELFGERTTRLELWLTIGFGVGVSALVLAATRDEWRTIALWRQLALVVLAFDIGGGVLGTLTHSTNRYYRNDAKARLTFILAHVQPVVLAFLLDSAYLVAVGVTAYTVVTALVTNALIGHPGQRVIGASFMLAGVTVLLLTVDGVPLVLMALFGLYMFKVIYGFAVDHDPERTG